MFHKLLLYSLMRKSEYAFALYAGGSAMKENYILKITELLNQTDDLSLLDFILKLLQKS